MFIEDIRLSILQRKWDDKVNKLMNAYKQKGKKSSLIMNQLKNIDADRINHYIREYYNQLKENYIKEVGCWFSNKEV